MLSVHIFHIGTTLTLLYLILADQTAKHRRICLLIIGKILELLCRLIKCQLLIFTFSAASFSSDTAVAPNSPPFFAAT